MATNLKTRTNQTIESENGVVKIDDNVELGGNLEVDGDVKLNIGIIKADRINFESGSKIIDRSDGITLKTYGDIELNSNNVKISSHLYRSPIEYISLYEQKPTYVIQALCGNTYIINDTSYGNALKIMPPFNTSCIVSDTDIKDFVEISEVGSEPLLLVNQGLSDAFSDNAVIVFCDYCGNLLVNGFHFV